MTVQSDPQLGPSRELTPPARAYSSAQIAAAELAAVWHRQWVIAGPSAAVAEPKSYLSTEVGGIPVVITRDRGGVLHALSNVCRHRGMILTDGCGSAMTLNCPNHAWTYALDGQLRGAPRATVDENFDPATIRLPEYAVVEWGPVILVNLDPKAQPPRAELSLISEVLAGADLDFTTMRQSGDIIDWQIEANWKIVIENYLECYHCSWVHRDLAAVIDVGDYRYAAEPVGDLLISTSPVKQEADDTRRNNLLDTSGPLQSAFWYLLLPGATVNVYPGAGAVEFTWYWPVDAQTTGARTLVLVAPNATPEYEAQLQSLIATVGEEDNHICEGMHKGMSTGVLERARIIPGNEPLISDFHAFLANRVSYDVIA